MYAGKRPTAENFWAKVEKTEGCWLWKAGRNIRGYGRIGVWKQVWLAHRFSWELAHGPIPAGLFVCHTCDNPPCVRPDHLFLGTNSDNMKDAKAKGRCVFPRGEQHARSRFLPHDIRAIRLAVAGGVGQTELAKELGVSQAAIHWIAKGKNWPHLPMAIDIDEQ